MRITVILGILLMSAPVYAAGEMSIPIEFIKLQAINFGAFVVGIFLLSRLKTVVAFFKKNKDDFIVESTQAQMKLEKAKKERDELKEKIKALETNYDEEIKRATRQAQSKYESILAETKENIKFLSRDLESQIEHAKRVRAQELKDLMMNSSIEKLKEELKTQVDEKLIVQFQKSFVENMGTRI